MHDGYSLFVSNLKATEVLQRSNFQLKVDGRRDRPQCAHMALMPSLRRRTALVNYAVVSSWVVLEKLAVVPSKENGAFSSSAQPQPLQAHATRVRKARRLGNANRTGYGLILIGLGHPLTSTGTGTGTGTGAEWRGAAWCGSLTSTRSTNP